MKAQVAPLEGNKVKVSIEVEETEVDQAIDQTFEKFAKDLRVPGFRPGKAPRRILEARIGRPAARLEALDQNIPVWYDLAVNNKGVDVISDPSIEVTVWPGGRAAGLRRRGGGQTPAEVGGIRGPEGDGARTLS